MPITRSRYNAHLNEWKLKAGRPYWPAYLFHFADVTAAASILTDGRLKSRATQTDLICDVAEPGALAANPDALKYVRLHFRPKNSFHLSTEGIKFRDDEFRRPTHMSIPVAILLDAGAVLTRDGVGFCGRKLAHFDAQAVFEEAGFNDICFADVYHDGNPGDRMAEIHDRRAAEVVVLRELALRDCLKFVYCRSVYDEMTLRFLCGQPENPLLKRIRVCSAPTELFFCWSTFIQRLEYADRFIRLKLFQGRNYSRGRRIRCEIEQFVEESVVRSCDFEDVINNDGVQIGPFVSDPGSTWKIKIEGCLAFQGALPHRVSELVPAVHR